MRVKILRVVKDETYTTRLASALCSGVPPAGNWELRNPSMPHDTNKERKNTNDATVSWKDPESLISFYRSRSDKPDNRRRLLHVHRLISNCRYFTRYCFTSIHIVCSRIEVYLRSKQSGMRCGRSGKLRACTQRRWRSTSLASADNQTRKNS